MRQRKKILPAGCAAVAAAAALTAAADSNLVRNGSFEQAGGDSVPLEWKFSRSGDVPVTALSTTPGAEGEKCLRVVNRQAEKKPNQFGLLSQTVRIKPDTDYLFSYKIRGKDVKDATWAFGKKWLIRQPVIGADDDGWKQNLFVLRVPADKMEGDNLCGIRLITEGPAEFDIDDVRIVPLGDNLLVNGSFDGIPGQIPPGWSYRIAGNAKVSGAVDTASALSGKTAFKFVNATPRNSNVYGVLTQVAPLRPEIDYVLKVHARGEGQGITLAVGSRWAHRLSLQPLTDEWRTYEMPFRLAKDEVGKDGSTPVVIISENVAPGVWIDDISITPKTAPNLPAALWQKNRVYAVDRLAGKFDGLKAIPEGFPAFRLPFSADNASDGKMPDAKNFSADVALGYDDVGLILLARVNDDTALPGTGGEMWQNDSIQIRIDRAAAFANRSSDTDFEAGFSVGRDGTVQSWCWDGGAQAGTPLSAKLADTRAIRTEQGYFLAARLHWDLLGGVKESGKFGFTVVINDSDSPTHRSVYFLTPGLHDKKYANEYIMALLDTGKPGVLAKLPTTSAQILEGRLLLSQVPENAMLTGELIDAAGKKFQRNVADIRGVKPGELVLAPFSLTLDGLAKGNFSIEFKLNGKSLGISHAVKADLYEQQSESVTELCARLDLLKKEFAQLYGDRPYSAYVSAPLAVLDRHLPLLQKRLKSASGDGEKLFYAEQAAMTGEEVADILNLLEKDLKTLRDGGKLPEAWKYRSSTVTLNNGWPVAEAVREDGRKEQRPVIFTGFGHFGDIDRDMAVFPGIGVNAVQIELGPRHLFPREGKTREFEPDYSVVNARILPMMEKAWKNNIKIALLISPHYHPDWLLKKYPELVAPSGFLKYEVNQPKAREMVQAYIAALFAKLKESPYFGAIHSICLSNEPVYSACRPDNPFSRQEFKRYMEKKYGPVAAFNKTAGSGFADYDAMLDAVTANDPAAKYEFYTFSRKAFADWHRLLAEEVKKAAPGMPVHTKIMVFGSPFEYATGVDPELMADFSDYNGNDNYFYRRGRWLADWNVTAMTHEMQISAKPMSIANTENHIIPDGETRPISNDHIYTANFQQFITGASTLVTWVWVDYQYEFARKNPSHAFIGNIFLRPGNTAAHCLSGLDGIRLAPEIRKFMEARPEVAILYSPTATILNSGSYRAETGALYTALSFTGYRPRFLSERQLARGEFGDSRLLYVAGAKNVSRAARQGMKKFTANGGKIALTRDSLTQDEFGNPAAPDFPTEPAAAETPDALAAQIHRSGVAPLPVSVKVAHEEGNSGVFFRMVPDGNGAWLVNLVNYNFEPRKIRLEGAGEWFDLIRESGFEPEFELAPLKPQLLRFTPKK